MIDKQQQRRLAYQARNEQPDKAELSRIICNQVLAQPAYQQAETVMWYLHCRSEVQTLSTVEAQLAGGKKIVIPYCTHDRDGQNQLGLWLLEDLQELAPGCWGILEPPQSRWAEIGRGISPQQLDLIVVPGVAFDRQGGRLGNGAGYYDRLLQQVREDTVLIALSFESQLSEKVLMDDHDVYMDVVITEEICYHIK